MASLRSECLKMLMAAPKDFSIAATASFISDMESFFTDEKSNEWLKRCHGLFGTFGFVGC